MSIARNRADANAPDDSITSADLAPDIVLTGGSVGIPSVTTANLPGASGGDNSSITPVNGMLVYNSTLGMLQQRAGGTWEGITTAPVITSFQYSDGAAATAEKTVVGLVSIACGTTNTSTTVTVAGDTLGIQVGMVVAGVGIPVGATVLSVIIDTSFVLSAAATVTDTTVTLTFGGAVIITGSNFDSVLAGGSANIAVTFDGTSATSISVNSLKTIITCTPPAHAAGTITLLLTNASGLTASTNFIYSAEAAWAATGALGLFVDGAFTNSSTVTIRIQATEASDTITYAQTNSAGVVNTDGIQGLTVGTGLGSSANSPENAGYLTGTLSATEGTTYPFYATATDAENQITTPTLFNIISAFRGSGGTVNTTFSGFKIHVFTTTGDSQAFTAAVELTVDYLVVAGGGGGSKWSGAGAGGGGAGGYRSGTGLAVPIGVHTISVGAGGLGWPSSGNGPGYVGTDSSIGSLLTASGGGFGGFHAQTAGAGGSGGGGAATPTVGGIGNYSGGGTAYSPIEGYNGGAGYGYSANYAGGGGGGAGAVGETGTSVRGGKGGIGRSDIFSLNSTLSNVILDGLSLGHTSGSYQYFAGGGGGGTEHSMSGTADGGLGGGGAGINGGAGVAGTVNTGGGGGSGSASGGAGGSGIVVIRYAV